eukprot:1918980-Prymnesium_polylepis.1
MTFSWSVNPRLTDNSGPVQSALSAAAGAETITLLGQATDGTNVLDNGQTFVFVLVVTNLLGTESAAYTHTVTRAAAPIPTIQIEAPPLLEILSTASTTLPASASLASCFSTGGVANIIFTWSNNATALLSTASSGTVATLLTLDATEAAQTNFLLVGSTLTSGVRYTMRVAGCMASDTTVCGYAYTDVALRDLPLQGGINGGNREVGEDDTLVLDACQTSDPDDSAAQCDSAGSCGMLQFVWTCVAVPPSSTCPATAPSTSTCSWSISGGTLPAGTFTIAVNVTNLNSPSLESVSGSVLVTVNPGTLPVIVVGATAAKQ